ncbi:hypothetical protein FB451DRAFT_1401857 [Mycena latifolia]|nr:hypothetical protein FB451DRAFT_1401857 [Mycena latifolia]
MFAAKHLTSARPASLLTPKWLSAAPLGFALVLPLAFAPHPHPHLSLFSSPASSHATSTTSSSTSTTPHDMSDLGLGGAYGAPSPLRSFASLSSGLDNLQLDMELAPKPSPSRRSTTPLSALPPSSFPSSTAEHTADPPPAPAPDHTNVLLLDLPPAPPTAALPPSPLNTLGPAARLPPGVPPPQSSRCSWRGRPHTRACHCEYERRWGVGRGTLEEVEALVGLVLGVLPTSQQASAASSSSSASASAALAHATASASATVGVGRRTLEYEQWWSVPRDTGEPRRRRKRAKEVGREVGLVLGVLPQPSSSSADDLAKQKKPCGEKAGLASVPALVTRMILRRCERCVRGLRKGRGHASGGWRLRCTLTLNSEGAEGREPPPMEVSPHCH